MRSGLMVVYVVLAVLFTSLLQPVTILFSLPLSIAGAILALLITNLPITTPVVIGILMLMGIVTKNAIMLVDFAVEAMHGGVDRTTAIIEAGRKRARPIIMTTIAMVAGMAPSALAFGAGGEFRSPMAIAIIGGLLVSTLLSLLFVPAFFVIMADVGRIFSRLIGRADRRVRRATVGKSCTTRKITMTMSLAFLAPGPRAVPARHGSCSSPRSVCRINALVTCLSS